jgi:hypothetical protein
MMWVKVTSRAELTITKLLKGNYTLKVLNIFGCVICFSSYEVSILAKL